MSPTRNSRLRVFGVSRTRPSHRARISPTSPTTVEATGMAQIGLLQELFTEAQSVYTESAKCSRRRFAAWYLRRRELKRSQARLAQPQSVRLGVSDFASVGEPLAVCKPAASRLPAGVEALGRAAPIPILPSFYLL